MKNARAIKKSNLVALSFYELSKLAVIMAEICCGVVNEKETTRKNKYEPSSRAARRRRMEIRRFKIISGMASSTASDTSNNNTTTATAHKRPKLEASAADAKETTSLPLLDDSSCVSDGSINNNSCVWVAEEISDTKKGILIPNESTSLSTSQKLLLPEEEMFKALPKFGFASVCGRRRDMEDAVSVHPSLSLHGGMHYFGVYDGHGCSHVATKCRDRLHELVKEEMEMYKQQEGGEENGLVTEWKSAFENSFGRMDKEVSSLSRTVDPNGCRCELRVPECDAVGSTAVVSIVTPEKIVVSNCGDSRAVLCRNGKAVPLSVDHKPDRRDELSRIQAAGGRVIYWEGPRVLGVLAMSRAIGDNYLKPYVSCEPEVTITDRMEEDECLIMASDGLWDVVTNETACGVARMCLRGSGPPSEAEAEMARRNDDHSDKACSDAAMLLTKLALARQSADNVSVLVVDLRKPT